jgi:hypothetical protein
MTESEGAGPWSRPFLERSAATSQNERLFKLKQAAAPNW